MNEIRALVPVMTSNTTPEGECVCDSENFAAWYEFNGSTFALNVAGTFWAPVTYAIGNYIGYKFTKKVFVKKFGFKSANSNDITVTKSITLIASNDGTNWTNLKTYSYTQYYWASGSDFYKEFAVNNDKDYLYYAIKFNDAIQDNDAGELQFYGTDEKPHLKATGNIQATRDWLNASLYNKEEIQDLFLRNNSGLQAYDLTITGDTPDQMIKMVGQTSGKTYNVCLAAILGDVMKDVCNINKYETPGRFFDEFDIYGQAIPFYENGAVESHWTYAGTIWTNSEIDGTVIDELFGGFVINQDDQGNFSYPGSGTIVWNKASENFTLDFSVGYNTWLFILYTKP